MRIRLTLEFVEEGLSESERFDLEEILTEYIDLLIKVLQRDGWQIQFPDIKVEGQVGEEWKPLNEETKE